MRLSLGAASRMIAAAHLDRVIPLIFQQDQLPDDPLTQGFVDLTGQQDVAGF
jgi:hypothetical protein